MDLGAWVQSFGSSPYVAAVANFIQIVSGPGLFVGIGAGAYAYWQHRCKVAGCLRQGQHPVHGTSWKVCPRHHTAPHHQDLRLIHRRRHPDRLSHGESG